MKDRLMSLPLGIQLATAALAASVPRMALMWLALICLWFAMTVSHITEIIINRSLFDPGSFTLAVAMMLCIYLQIPFFAYVIGKDAGEQGLRSHIASLQTDIAALRQELDQANGLLIHNAPRARRGHVTQGMRVHILKRCHHACQFCARPGTSEHDPDGQSWHIEHVIPVNKGGPTRADNLTLACSSCNLRKGTMPAYAFIQKLVREGVRKA